MQILVEETRLTVTEILDGLQKNLAGRNRKHDDRLDVIYWAQLLRDRAAWIEEVSQRDTT